MARHVLNALSEQTPKNSQFCLNHDFHDFHDYKIFKKSRKSFNHENRGSDNFKNETFRERFPFLHKIRQILKNFINLYKNYFS